MLSERVDSARLNELARKGADSTLRLPISDLGRLSACMHSSEADQDSGEPAVLVADVKFDIGPEGFPRIGLAVTGRISLQCQRCMEAVVWPVRIDTRLAVLDSDEQTELIANPFDSVLLGSEGMHLATVIEDEVLAALPMVPVHKNELQCQQAGGKKSNLLIDAELMQRPFADLASLVGSRKYDADD